MREYKCMLDVMLSKDFTREAKISMILSNPEYYQSSYFNIDIAIMMMANYLGRLVYGNKNIGCN